MGNYIKIRLSDIRFNAAVLGFVRMCGLDRAGAEVDLSADVIEVDKAIFDNFAEKYVAALVKRFGGTTQLASFYQRLQLLERREAAGASGDQENADGAAEEKKYAKNVADLLDAVIKKFESASFKSGAEIAKSVGLTFNLPAWTTKLKSVKKSGDSSEILGVLRRFLDEVEDSGNGHRLRDIFLMKEIIYNNVAPFWNGIAFLNRAKTKSDYVKEIRESFEKKLVSFQEAGEKKTSIRCSQCDAAMTKTQAESMSWLNDLGVDIARKHSPYWNCSPDVVLCPVCKAIYACLPFGFTMVGRNGVFVNENSSCEALLQYNNFSDRLDEDRNVYYTLLKTLVLERVATDKEALRRNWQVLYRSDNRYRIHNYSRDRIEKLYRCREDLRRIVSARYSINGEWFSVFEETIRRVMNGQRLDDLIYTVLAMKIRQPELSIYYAGSLIRINSTLFLKGGPYMGDVQKDAKGVRSKERMLGAGEQIREAERAGANLRRRLAVLNESKVRSISYRLLNAVNLNDPGLFVDTVARQYLGLGEPIPSIFIQIQRREDDFVRIGHSFILGLNQGDTPALSAADQGNTKTNENGGGIQ